MRSSDGVTAPASAGPFVGIDVVDLHDPRTADRHTDARFVERVLAPSERDILHAAPDARADLWALWAAKEAAYKVASKLRGEPPIFQHAAFRTSWSDCADQRRAGTVGYEGTTIPVEVEWDTRRLLAVAVSTGSPGEARSAVELLAEEPLDTLLSRLTAREREAVHSVASAAVRLGARSLLAQVLGADENEVEIVCSPGVTGRRPPHALLRGSAAPADVSLSHHGRWLAWAVLRQNQSGR